MHRFADRRFTFAAKHPLLHQLRNGGVQTIHVAHSTAQDNHIRVEDIDHVRQRFCQPHFVATERQFRHRIVLLYQPHDLIAFQRMPA